MSVIHADLVVPLPEGKNYRNQRGFQYILSVVDSATRYLWLLPIRHKTAECVAATLFDEVISRISVPSSILTDQGGEFTGEVVECLLKRFGITHLRTSAYHPETDAKCERAHFYCSQHDHQIDRGFIRQMARSFRSGCFGLQCNYTHFYRLLSA